MENFQLSVLNGSDVKSDHIHQYIELNQSEYPKFTREIKFLTFKNFLNQNEDRKIIIATSGDKLIGWLMVSFADKLGIYHFNMLVHRDFQRTGIGSKLLLNAKEHYNELYGVVVPVNRYKRRDGTQYQSPLGFYLKNDFHPTGKKFLEYRDVTMVEIKWSNK